MKLDRRSLTLGLFTTHCVLLDIGRVRQMKGLTNDPICSVEDNLTRPRPMSALTDRDLGSGYIPPGSSRYSANVNKQLFAVGVGQSVK